LHPEESGFKLLSMSFYTFLLLLAALVFVAIVLLRAIYREVCRIFGHELPPIQPNNYDAYEREDQPYYIGINPASGLPMSDTLPGFDIGGNPLGCDFEELEHKD